MAANVHFTRSSGLIVPPNKPEIVVASLGPLRSGYYLVLAKVIVVTRFEDSGDFAFAHFSLTAGDQEDKALCALSHTADRGSLQPADTISLHLAARVGRVARRRGGSTLLPDLPQVTLSCRCTF